MHGSRFAAFAFLGASALACNAVLGIDAASVDPSLADGGGTPCDSYCASVMANCTGANQEYLDSATCLAMCRHFEPGVSGDTTQDSLACRTYHAGAAATDPDFHCRHAGPVGGGVCGTDPCAPFCLLDFALCGDMASPPYSGGESGCHAACTASLTYQTSGTGDLTQSTGNTLNCRIYHLESAYEPNNPDAKTTHCRHTAIQSATCQ
jgi:hypothetical protein